MPSEISYAIENDLGADEFIDLLRRSTLAERRPVDDAERIEKMLAFGNLIVVARDPAANDLAVGVARCLTDYAYCCYCSDLAVDTAYQKAGIGQQLLEECEKAAGPGANFFLHAAPDALSYYPHIGMVKMENAFKSPTARGGRD